MSDTPPVTEAEALSSATASEQYWMTLARVHARLTNLDVPLSTIAGLTDAQLRALAVAVSGPATNAELRASPLPVSGPVTDTQLRASAVPVSAAALPLPAGASTEATLAAIKAKTDNLDVALSTRTKPADTQTVSGSVSVSNFPATQPVSGTVTANAGSGTLAVSGPATDAQLRASPLPVSGTVTANVGTGTQPVSGTFFQATQPVSAAALPLPSGASTEATLALIKAKTDNLDVALSTRTKPGDTQPVSGTFWQATQPVSGTFFQGTQPVSGSVSVSNFPATQPVSAAALPLPSGASTEATLATLLTAAAFLARHPVQGQALMAASVPVVLASDQAEQAIARSTRNAAEMMLIREMDQQVASLQSRGRERITLITGRGSR